MTFVFPLLLGGALLAGVPVILHLIMRQQPKHVIFPAFRFLMERQRTNQRKLRLRHLLLLALRMGLILAAVLALSRPRLFSQRFHLSSERPIAAVVVVDTSPSMSYTIAGKSRLDAARARISELLGQLPEGSRAALLDTADVGGAWEPSLDALRDRLESLTIGYANRPLTSRLPDAFRLLSEASQTTEADEEPLPLALYLFSDRTVGCWDGGRASDLRILQDRLARPVRGVFVDVGADQPIDVAILGLDISRQAVALGQDVEVRATAKAVGQPCDTEVICIVDGNKVVDRKNVRLEADRSQSVAFKLRDLAAGFHQLELRSAVGDALAFNNSLYATVEVRGGRPVLLICDQIEDAAFLKAALETALEFQPNVVTPEAALGLPDTELKTYRAICLLGVRKPSINLWELLRRHVSQGGGLLIVPGGEDTNKLAYQEGEATKAIVPARLKQIIDTRQSRQPRWRGDSWQHPFLKALQDERRVDNLDFERLPPSVTRYWQIEAVTGRSSIIIRYDDTENSSALVELLPGLPGLSGKVVLATTALDSPNLRGNRPWNDYLTTSFYQVFSNLLFGYLAGATDEPQLNFICGQPARVALSPANRLPAYRLEGKGMKDVDASVPRSEQQLELLLPEAASPGNFQLSANKKVVAKLSVNEKSEESNLDRASKEGIEELLGNDCILPVGETLSLKDAVQGHFSQPVELLPWLLLLLLTLLAGENVLANAFYRASELAGGPRMLSRLFRRTRISSLESVP